MINFCQKCEKKLSKMGKFGLDIFCLLIDYFDDRYFIIVDEKVITAAERKIIKEMEVQGFIISKEMAEQSKVTLEINQKNITYNESANCYCFSNQKNHCLQRLRKIKPSKDGDLQE